MTNLSHERSFINSVNETLSAVDAYILIHQHAEEKQEEQNEMMVCPRELERTVDPRKQRHIRKALNFTGKMSRKFCARSADGFSSRVHKEC